MRIACRIGAALGGLLVVALWASPAGAEARGEIKGRVTVVRVPPPMEERPTIADLGLSPSPAPADRRRSVVYLETAPAGAFEETGPDRVVLHQKNQAFSPYVLAVRVGTSVEFPNDDRIYHNVFSLSKAKRFDLGRYAPGVTRSVRFDRPGVVRVFCEIHSHMSAFILVFAHRYFATTDGAGEYEIEGVPPGAYTLVVWNDGAERGRRAIEVRERGVTEADFTVE